MLARALQRLDVAGARDEQALRRRLPAGELEQALAQRVEPFAGQCREHARRSVGRRRALQSSLLKTWSDAAVGDQARRQPRGDRRVAALVAGVADAASGRAGRRPRRRPRSRPSCARCRSARPRRPPRASRRCRRRAPARLRSGSSGRPCRASCPAIGVTIASSAPASAFSSELLPTFGWPASTTRMPSRSNAPWRARASTASTRARDARAGGRARRRAARKSISSSGKSSVASTSMRSSTSAAARASISLENAPSSERAAERAAASVLGVDQVGHRFGLGQVELVVEEGALGELARVGDAQAGQARRSGGASVSAAASRQRASSSCSTTAPPCACSSSTSSPV